jgi:hypothetical protein
MNLNNIQLQDLVVGELYKDALLVSYDAAKEAASADGGQSLAPADNRASAKVASVPEQSEGNERVQARDDAWRSSGRGEAAQPKLSGIVQNSQPRTGNNSAQSQPSASATPTSSAQSVTTAPEPAAPESQPPDPETAAPYKILGNHRRKVTILVNAPGSPFLPDNQLNFLTKILEACRLNMGDVAIINHASAPVNITALRAQLQPSVILLFGLEPTTIRLPINFPVFKLQPYDQCTYLSAPALDLLVQSSEDSRPLKSKLWVCLKSLFEV